MSNCECHALTAKEATQRRTLWILLAINGAMFGLEAVMGWLAQSFQTTSPQGDGN